MGKSGSKGKLTKELIDEAEKLVKKGNFDKVVYNYLGISYNTWYLWLKDGEKDFEEGRNSLKREFYERIKRAEAWSEDMAIEGILSAGKNGNWQSYAWFLERKYFNRWGKKERTELTGKDGNPIEISNIKEELVKKLSSLVEDGEEDNGK